MRTASSSLSSGMTTSTGPKISSRATTMSGVTPEKTVGPHVVAAVEPVGLLRRRRRSAGAPSATPCSM